MSQILQSGLPIYSIRPSVDIIFIIFIIFIILGHLPRVAPHTPHPPWDDMLYLVPCISDADWCLQSDVIPDSRLVTWA